MCFMLVTCIFYLFILLVHHLNLSNNLDFFGKKKKSTVGFILTIICQHIRNNVNMYYQTAWCWETGVAQITSVKWINNGMRRNLETQQLWDFGILPVYHLLLIQESFYYICYYHAIRKGYYDMSFLESEGQ